MSDDQIIPPPVGRGRLVLPSKIDDVLRGEAKKKLAKFGAEMIKELLEFGYAECDGSDCLDENGKMLPGIKEAVEELTRE